MYRRQVRQMEDTSDTLLFKFLIVGYYYPLVYSFYNQKHQRSNSPPKYKLEYMNFQVGRQLINKTHPVSFTCPFLNRYNSLTQNTHMPNLTEIIISLELYTYLRLAKQVYTAAARHNPPAIKPLEPRLACC